MPFYCQPSPDLSWNIKQPLNVYTDRPLHCLNLEHRKQSKHTMDTITSHYHGQCAINSVIPLQASFIHRHTCPMRSGLIPLSCDACRLSFYAVLKLVWCARQTRNHSIQSESHRPKSKVDIHIRIQFKWIWSHVSLPNYRKELLAWYSDKQVIKCIPNFRRKCLQNGFSVCCAKLWNSLPADIKASCSFHSFRRKNS